MLCYGRHQINLSIFIVLYKNMESILDQVITAKHLSNLASFNPHDTLDGILAALTEREREIIKLRHGLSGYDKKTLEDIGKQYAITRERVRQIENSSLKKIIKNFDETYLQEIEDITNGILSEHGGLMAETNLIKELLTSSGYNDDNHSAVVFILGQLLKHRFQFIRENKEYFDYWKTPESSVDFYDQAINKVIDIVENHGNPLSLDILINKIQETEYYKENENLTDKVVLNFIYITKKLKSNPYEEWGLSHWADISPKRMNDKIYLVLKKENRPMHFNEIAETINKMDFDHRQAYPATIHNELILDDKYVLVGRGIYALKEWGYKPGVVSDVIEEILRKSDRPLSKKEIVEEVLKHRMIKETTVTLALMNKNRFEKNENGKYSLKNA
ncbi:MAG: HARE-type protein [Patescibacteria group bacterium]|nr:HARE-type protein [Patescibacteria group bacterium]